MQTIGQDGFLSMNGHYVTARLCYNPKACGAYGRMVGGPDDVIPAMEEGFVLAPMSKVAVLDVNFERTIAFAKVTIM